MKKKQWRTGALFLTVSFIISVLTISAFIITAMHVKGAAAPWSYSLADVDETAEGDQYFSIGNGTGGSPYEIDTAQELANMSFLINNSTPGYNTASYILTADVILNDWNDDGDGIAEDGELSNNGGSQLEWTSIGSKDVKFSGSFNGNNNKVLGLFIKKIGTAQTDNYQGLFGNVENGTIKNLTVAEGYIFGFGYIGGIAGNLTGTGSIDNCLNECTVVGRGSNYTYGSYGGVGGIAGYSGGRVSNCRNKGLISSQKPDSCTSYSAENIGGIVGNNYYGTVTDCFNTGDVNCTSVTSLFVGGVVGCNQTDSTIRNSYNTGNVSAENYVGGIAGISQEWGGPVTIEYCFNTGSVTGTYYIGGIAGCAAGGYTDIIGTSLVQYCYNTGNISGTEVGGIVGSNRKYYPETSTTSTVQYCYNAGTLSSSSGGNIIGGNTGIVVNCLYDMQMNTFKGIGGIGSDTAGQTEGRLTSEMVSSDLASILGPDGTHFEYEDGLYPRLVGMDTSDAAYVSASPMFLNGTGTVNLISRDFTISTLHGVIWSSDNPGSISINGGDATIVGGNGSAVNLTASLNGFKRNLRVTPCATITEAGVAGIIAPSAGALPQTSGSLAAVHASYSIASVSWKDSDGTTPATLINGKFKEETVYKAVIELRAGASSKFKVLTPSVNTGTVTVGAINTDIAGNTLTFTVTFPETLARGVTDITISTQPAKMNYFIGTDDILALDGMVVTETYSDGSTETVNFTDGTAEGYTSSLTNGTQLSIAQNNTKVTITHVATGQSAQTAALAVSNFNGSTLNLSTWLGGDTIIIPAYSTVTLTGSRNNTKILCGEGVALTLNNVTISNNISGYGPVSFTTGENTLVITGSSTLSAGPTAPGVNSGAGSLTIRGTGSLAATGGKGAEPGGPGIGTRRGEPGGSINIESGTIVAIAGDSGRKSRFSGGEGIISKTITITGGTVTAEGFRSYAGIGAGFSTTSSSVTISGGTVTARGDIGSVGIGSWGNTITNGNTINISGGRVVASSGSGGTGAGIGGSIGNYITGSVKLTGGEIFANCNGTYNIEDIGSPFVGSWTLEIGGTAAVFLKNNNCVTPVTSTHIHETYTDVTSVYGIQMPTGWTGTFGTYLCHPTISYDLNGGRGVVPAAVTQLAGTTTTVGQSGDISLTGSDFCSWNTAPNGSGDAYQPEEIFTFGNSDVTLYAQWAEILTAASISGITAPSVNTLPQGVGSLIVGQTGYTLSKLTWKNSDGSPATLTAGGNFKARTVYKAEIELTAAKGYKFQTLTPTVNTGSPEAGTVNSNTEGNKLTFMVTFPATGEGQAVETTESAAQTQVSSNTVPGATGVDILVNGKTETAATATTIQDGENTITTIEIDNEKVDQKLQQEGNNAVVTVQVNNSPDVVTGRLNGQTVKNMEAKDAVLEIKTGQVTYTLPAAQINIDAVSEQVGKQVALKDIVINLKISEPEADTVKLVQDTASVGGYQIMVKPVQFEITCSGGNKTVEVSKFNAYVERLIAIPEGVEPSKITTGIVLNSDGTFSHVPTVITVINGKYYAKINSLTNSVYAVISSPKTFADVENHWSKEAVNDMASRLVIEGVTDDQFSPDKDMTRAEFANILIKALGLLRPGTGKAVFSDVTKEHEYYDAVSIAYDYGIISGYGNGKFGPEDSITREQVMTMIASGMKITKLSKGLTDSEVRNILSGYIDGDSISGYAETGFAACLKNGILTGRNNKMLAPKDDITRGEVAVIIRSLLKKSRLI